MVLKYSFKLFFVKCTFEFMTITAPKRSNSVNGRENYFKLLVLKIELWICRMVPWYVVSLSALGEVGVQVQIRAGLLSYFFLVFVCFFLSSYLFSLWLDFGYSHCCPFKLHEIFAIMYF